MKYILLFLAAFLIIPVHYGIYAHPGSGLVTDNKGNIYFIDTGSGVWKIDVNGNVSRVSTLAYHWMAIDVNNALEDVKLPYFRSDDATVARVGKSPTLILSSDFPVAVGPDGSLFYPWVQPGDQLKIFRLTPAGSSSDFKAIPPTRSGNGEIRWRNGITVAGDGSVYFSEDRAIQKITPGGELVTVIHHVDLPGCGSVEGVEAELGPYFRGLAVDSEGTVYVAAAGCRSVLQISASGQVKTILQSSDPWSPTSVAMSGSDLYVLEYTHTPGDNRQEWLPRIRKVDKDGQVTTLFTMNRSRKI